MTNSVKETSNKVDGVNNIYTRQLNLPSMNYGPFCLKILHEFIIHHGLSKDLPLPNAGSSMNVSLSRIFDVMLHSMGREKRDAILADLDQYNLSVPAFFRD